MHGKVKRDITGINKDKRNAKAARLSAIDRVNVIEHGKMSGVYSD